MGHVNVPAFCFSLFKIKNIILRVRTLLGRGHVVTPDDTGEYGTYFNHLICSRGEVEQGVVLLT